MRMPRLWGLGARLLLFGCSSLAAAQVPVEFVQPQVARVAQELSLTGTVNTPLDATLSPEISGLVSEVLIDAGDRVEAGQPLLRLDATLEALRLDVSVAALREAGTRLSEARRLRDEARPLAQGGGLSKSDFASLQAAAEQASAAVARLQAEQAEQAERVMRHTLKAPFAGVIRERLTAPGEWVATGTPVLELVAVDDLSVDVQVPQQRFTALQDTSEAWVMLDALPGEEHAGRVSARVAAMDPRSRSFLVRVELPEAVPGMAPGMSARVRFQLPGDLAAVAIPRDALVRFPDGSQVVWVIDEQDHAQRRPVQLGQQRGERVVISAGLATDDRVVVRGNESLKPGQAVKAKQHQP